MNAMYPLDIDSLAFDDRGLVAAIAQDIATGAVLMLAWADREAVARTLETGFAHFWSRSRRTLWKKGETSGNLLRVRSIEVDCDRDALLLRVDPAGPACHRGTRTCFEDVDGSPTPRAPTPRLELGWLADVLESRRESDPESSYTARLLAEGVPRVAQKVGEEAVETVIAAVAGGDDFADEAADLLYHLMVLCVARGVDVESLAATLRRRHVGDDPVDEERA